MAVSMAQYQKPDVRRPMRPLVTTSVAGYALALGTAICGAAIYGHSEGWRAVGVGAAVGLMTMATSLAVLAWGLGQSMTTLLTAVLAATGLRAGLFIAVLFAAVKVGGYAPMPTAIVAGWVCLGVLVGETLGLKAILAKEPVGSVAGLVTNKGVG